MDRNMQRLVFLVTIILMVDRGLTQSAPTHCSYIEDNLFRCDYTAMTSSSNRPIEYTGFNPEPQRIELLVDSLVPYFGDTEVFSTFEIIDINSFNENYPASLIMDCEGSTVLFFTGAFANMSHVQHLTIRNCDILELPSSVFADFENLDYFKIEGGQIDAIDVNAFLGLNVEKLTSDAHTIPRNVGKFEIWYTKFPTTSVPAGLLYNMKNLTTAVLRGTGITTVTADTFNYNTKIKHIDLSDNDFTNLPEGIFDNLNALKEVRLENIQWYCTCTNVWLVPYLTDRNITFYGEGICSNVEDTIFDYYHTNCLSSETCDGKIGFVIGKICQTLLGLIITCMAIIALIVSLTTLIIIVHSNKVRQAKDRKRRQAVGRWNQVIDMTIRKSKKI